MTESNGTDRERQESSSRRILRDLERRETERRAAQRTTQWLTHKEEETKMPLKDREG